jgi:hypothetical protein
LCAGEVYPCRAACTAQRALDVALEAAPPGFCATTDGREPDAPPVTTPAPTCSAGGPVTWFGTAAGATDSPARGLGLAALYRRGSPIRLSLHTGDAPATRGRPRTALAVDHPYPGREPRAA